MEFHNDDMYINANVTCCVSVQSPYYKQKIGPLCCHNCGVTIDDAEAVSAIAKLNERFSIVKPSCGSAKCPEHSVSRPKKPKATLAARQQKRKRVKTETNVAV